MENLVLEAIKKTGFEPTPTVKTGSISTEPVIKTATTTPSVTYVPSSIPVRNTSYSNATSIAQSYRDRGYTAEVVPEGGDRYRVVLGGGTSGVTPLPSTAPEITTVGVEPTMPKVVAPPTPAKVPVSGTSYMGAVTIAESYRNQGFTAKVESEGGGKYRVVLSAGPSGVVPYVKMPEPTEYFTGFGYKPKDIDYSTIYGDIETQKLAIASSVAEVDPIIESQKEQLKKLEASPVDTKWLIDDVEYSKSEAISYLKGIIASNEAVVATGKTSLSELKQQKELIEAYETGGYEVDITEKGYEFKTPSAKEVHEWYYGKDLSGTRFVAKQAMTWGIPAAISAGTGTWEAFEEEEYRRLLELSAKKGEGAGSYTMRFWTSPEAIESVYLPLATMGIGEVYTGLKAGATGIATTGKLAQIGKEIGTRGVSIVGKSLWVAGGVGAAISGVHIGTTFATQPEIGPRAVGEVAFGWLIAGAGFKAGEMAYYRTTPTKILQPSFKHPSLEESMAVSKQMPFVEQTGKGTQYVETPGRIPGSKMPTTEPVYQFTPKGKGYIGETSAKLFTFQPEGSEVVFTKGLRTTEFNIRGGWKLTQFEMIKGLAQPILEQGAWTIYSTLSVHELLGGGKKIVGFGKTITGPTGEKFEVPVGIKEIKGTIYFEPSTKTGSITAEMILDVKTFTEYESLSIGRFTEGTIFGKRVGAGLDVSRLYMKQPTGFGEGGFGVGGAEVVSGGDLGVSKLSIQPVTGGVVSMKPPVVGPVASEIGGVTTFAPPKTGAVEDVVGVSALATSAPLVTAIVHKEVFAPPRLVSKEVPSVIYHRNLIQELKMDMLQEPVLEYETGLEHIELLQPTISTIPIIGTMEIQETILETMPIQKTELEQATLLEEVLIQEPVITLTVITPVVTPPFVPPPLLKKEVGKPMGIQRGVSGMLIGERRGRGKPKSILSDLLSVTKSQAWYGTATHPRPTRETFSKGRVSMYMHVPTVEMMERGKTRKGFFGNLFAGKQEKKLVGKTGLSGGKEMVGGKKPLFGFKSRKGRKKNDFIY